MLSRVSKQLQAKWRAKMQKSFEVALGVERVDDARIIVGVVPEIDQLAVGQKNERRTDGFGVTQCLVFRRIRIDGLTLSLDDRKWAFVRLEGRNFGDIPLSLEYKLEVWDSPNSAGIIIDAIRAAKIALDRGIGGPLLSASSYFMKSPPEQYGDDVCRDKVEAFLKGESEI